MHDAAVIVFGPGLPGRGRLRCALEETLPGVKVLEGDFRTAQERLAVDEALAAAHARRAFVAWECDAGEARRQIFQHYAGLPARVADQWWRRYEADRAGREPPGAEIEPIVIASAARPTAEVVAEVAQALGVLPARAPQATPRVMVVDDDPPTREALAEAMEELGCTVVQAGSGAEAIELVRGHPIDLLATDLEMPGTSGIELAAQVARIRPEVRVAVITGHADEAIDELLRAPHVDLVLTKPVAGIDLINLVAELRGPPGGALRRSEARWRELFEHASDGIFVADLEGRYVEVNAAGCQLLGYSRDELVGMTIVDLLPPEDVGRLWRSREVLLTGEVEVAEWTLRRKDGSLVPVEVSAKILADGRWQGFVRDISDRKAAAAALQRARDAERRLREDWAAVITHDLRQPINTIALTAETFLARPRAALDDRERRAFERIRAASQRQGRMIDGLLDALRTDAKDLAVDRQVVDLAALIDRVADDVAAVVADQRIVVRTAAGLSAWVDQARIEQILGTLLARAVEHGEPGRDIAVEAFGRGEQIEVVVTSRGPGDPADSTRLVTRFAGARAAPDEPPGAELGLFVSRGVILAHGGELWLTSSPGESRVHFTVPRHPPAVAAPG